MSAYRRSVLFRNDSTYACVCAARYGWSAVLYRWVRSTILVQGQSARYGIGRYLVSLHWSCPFTRFYSLWSFNAVHPLSDFHCFGHCVRAAAKSRKPGAHELLI